MKHVFEILNTFIFQYYIKLVQFVRRRKFNISSPTSTRVFKVTSCWPLVPKFAGSKPSEAVGFLRAKKILSTPSFGGEVKPSVPCRRCAACKSSRKCVEGAISVKLSDNILAHLSPLGSLASWRTWGHLVVKVRTSKRGGKQWQTTPKNLSRMQRTRAIPVAWLSSGLCPDRP
jgi:hypothetical protein